MKNSLIVTLLLGTLFAGGLESGADQRSSPVEIEIRLKNDAVKVGEPIEGSVVVRNTYPAALPVIFDIHLTHNGRPHFQSMMSVPNLTPGTTKFDLQTFGIPQFNAADDSKGTWQIRIQQKDVGSEQAAIATITISP